MITNKHQPVPFRLTTRKSDKKRPRVLSRLVLFAAGESDPKPPKTPEPKKLNEEVESKIDALVNKALDDHKAPAVIATGKITKDPNNQRPEAVFCHFFPLNPTEPNNLNESQTNR